MTPEAETHRGLLVSGRFLELEDALCERVAELKQRAPLAPLTIVVGSAAVRTRVGDLLVRRLRAIANIGIFTLPQLAVDLVTEAHGEPPVVLTGLARERLVRRLVETRRSELRYFTGVVDRPHFAEALAATFADLREGCVSPETPWAAALASAGWSAPGAARDKAADLDLLYGVYCRELGERGLLDGAGVQLAAARAASVGRARAAIIYGIYDLNQAQKALVDALIRTGADVLVPVPRHRRSEGVTMRDAALAAGLRERLLDAPTVRDDLGRVAAVWSEHGAAAGGRLELEGGGVLTVVSVPDERAETREAVRSVLEAAVGSGDEGGTGNEPGAGAPLWDCAIVVPRGGDVVRMAAALEAAGLPVACRRPDRSPGPRLLLRLADCLAPLAGRPFARRAVVDLLTAAPLRHGATEPVETALWLDEARRAGVVSGIEQWTEHLRRRRSGLEKRLAEFEVSSADAVDDDDEASDKLGWVRLRLAAARGLEHAAGALTSACYGLPSSPATWGAWAEAFTTVLEALFEPSASAAARDAASRLRGLEIVGEEVGLQEAAAAMRTLLAAGRVPVGRIGRDGVAVATPLELRGLSFHTVVFTGLAEGGFPVRGRPDPILGDRERERIADLAADETVRLPVAGERADESLLLFAFACEAARSRLVLLAPRTDAATGRPRLPSRLLLRLAALGAGGPVGQDDFLKGKGLGPVWLRVSGAPVYDASGVVWVDARERDTAVLLGLSQGTGASAARAYLAEVLADSAAAERRLGAWRASRSLAPGAWDGLLSGAACSALAARHPLAGELSPTRLERYIACPFTFFLRYVLGLEVPEEPSDSLEIDPLEFGRLVHEILQRAYRRVIDERLSLDEALAAVAGAWQTCCDEAERRGVTGAELSWRVRRELLRDDLLRSVRGDPALAAGGGRPGDVEWTFGEAAQRPVGLDLDPEADGGRRVRFKGRIDRFDITPLGARVIDYKTGAGNSEDDRVKSRLSVQLPVYQLAVRQAGGEEHDEVWCLYRFVTRRGGFRDLPLPEDEQATLARLRELVAGAVDLIDAGMFPRTTAGRCTYCDVRYACGFSAWARARKRRHESLAAVVRLQGPPDGGAGDDT
jgi:RecB family exonuclease